MPTNRLAGQANAVHINGLRFESPRSQVIPDSEDERQREREENKIRATVIVISSDESDNEGCMSITMSPTKPSVVLPTPSKIPSPRKRNPARPIILSSDDDSDEEIVQTPLVPKRIRATDSVLKGKGILRDDDPIEVSDNDDAVIIFDEPKRGTKPIKKRFDDILPPSRSSTTPLTGPSASTPTSRRLKGKVAIPESRSNLEDQTKSLRDYAEELFSDLNSTVFKDGLPASTRLNWNKRLLKTAGRAKYHRSRDGVQMVEIELATKILDCQERVRNTLSHEMCHLATWIIDKRIDEHHGKLFKKWANLVMQTHPEIDVSVRHDYEISYPFEWKCERCGKIYGRFSKSIRPNECFCGVCKEGTLVPLFNTKRTKTVVKMSKLAAGNPQDSPKTIPNDLRSEIDLTDTDVEDSTMEILTTTLASTSIVL